MNRLRAEEIELQVFYRNIDRIPYDKMDLESAFYVGRIVGIMQETLRRELDTEVSKELSEVEE